MVTIILLNVGGILSLPHLFAREGAQGASRQEYWWDQRAGGDSGSELLAYRKDGEAPCKIFGLQPLSTSAAMVSTHNLQRQKRASTTMVALKQLVAVVSDGASKFLRGHGQVVDVAHKIDRLTADEELMLSKIIRVGCLMRDQQKNFERQVGHELSKQQWADLLHMTVAELDAKLEGCKMVILQLLRVLVRPSIFP